MSSLFDTGVIPVVNKWLLKQSEVKRDYGNYWSASSAGYCMRKTIFERLGVPPVQEEDPRKQRVYSAGHIFHDWLQSITKEAGVSIAQELELQDEDFKIRGHIDDLVLLDDELILYDYKTAHSKWFEYAKNQPMSRYHRHQLGTYLYMIRNSKTDFSKVTEARILKVSKDDLRLYEQELLWSPELEKDIKDYWDGLNVAWAAYSKSGELPECACALYEVNKKTGVGFMADPKWNPYYYHDEPCSLDWFNEWKLEQVALA